jgi:hypothetical protein
MEGGIRGKGYLVSFGGSHLLLFNSSLLDAFLDLCICTIPFESFLISSATRSADFELLYLLHIWRRIADSVRRLDLLYIIYEILSRLGTCTSHSFLLKIFDGVDALACPIRAVAEAPSQTSCHT